MLLKISNKEQNRIKTATEYYTNQGLKVSVENLEIGDYIFTDNNNSVVFEFKTISDFIASIQDNRVFNEAINQAENYDYHYVIIQGDEHTRAKCLAMSKHYRPVTYFQYLGAIASLNRYTTVIESYTPHIHEAYYRMLITARKSLDQKPIVKKFPRKNKNPAMNYLTYCVYGINSKRAELIVDGLNLHSLNDLLNLTINDLTSIKGIDVRLADTIIKTING